MSSAVGSSTAAAHAGYRSRLATIADPGWAGEVAGALGLAGDWARIYGRFRPGDDAWALTVLEQAAPAQRLLVVEVCAAAPSPGAGPAVASEAGWLRARPAVGDERLPGLAPALESLEGSTIVRYRPGRRCTLRGERDGARVFAKVFPDARARVLQRTACELAAARAAGRLEFDVVDGGAVEHAGSVLVQAGLPGTPIVDELRGPRAAPLARRLGHALASLHRAPLEPCTTLDRAGLQTRLERDAGALVARVPTLTHEVATLLERAGQLVAACPRGRIRPLHGSPHASQWLADGERLALVDFDRFGAGEPEFDVATFQAELLFERGLTVAASELNGAFADGVRDGGVPLEERLLRAYTAQKCLCKALRSASALRPDGDAAAARHLARASAALAGAEA